MKQSTKYPPNLDAEFTGVEVRACNVGFPGMRVDSHPLQAWYAQRVVAGVPVERKEYCYKIEEAEADAEELKAR